MNFDAVLIAGPTATGKSAAAAEIAARIGGVVVNADSMQVYKELRVLTARPDAEAEARVPHRLYGHVPVTERYSVGRYAEEAAQALAEARGAGRVPIFVGGTGLYFGALTEGLSPIPPVSEATRVRVRVRHTEQGCANFFAALAAVDPETASGLKPGDTQRVLRAAAVLEETGRGLRRWQTAAGRPVLAGLRVVRFVLAPPRAVVTTHINARAAAMIADGALAEARALAGLDPTLPAAKVLGVEALAAHLAGETDLPAALAALRRDTGRYAKRQGTWFRQRMRGWTWIIDTEMSNIISRIMAYLT